MESTPAILLRKTRLTETSLVITWLTQDLGKLKTVAKGARRPKSKFAGVLDLFFQCEIQFQRSRQTDLHVLMEASLLDPHENLRFDYTRLSLAGYFVELLDLVTEPEHQAADLYDLLLRALSYLNRTGADKRALLHFEAELARLLGIQRADVTPAVSIGRAYHRLPQERAELLGKLK
jgi:DNA repair protein RecO (recombination protein O)